MAKPHRLLSPFTGEPVKKLGRVLTVKIDNIVYARPQTGINDADIVYVLPVEGGLTRFLAVFSLTFPAGDRTGAQRAARRSAAATPVRPPCVRVLWRPGPATSRGGKGPDRRPLRRHCRRVLYRDYQRIAPYNLFASTKVLLREARGASKARNIGFKFGPAPFGGRVTRSETVTYPSAKFRFTWSASKHHWLVSMDGVPAKTSSGIRFSAATVVIQRTVVRKSGFLEYGVPPPFAQTIGHGTAIVLRNGKAFAAHWSRRNWNGGTTFTTPSGKVITFATGQVWILLTGNRRIEAG